LLALARGLLAAFVRVIASDHHLGRFLDEREVARAAAEWSGPTRKRRQSIQTWESCKIHIADKWSRWREHLCISIEKTISSQEGVEALATIGGPECSMVLTDWLRRNCLQDFKDVASVKHVALFLVASLSPGNVSDWPCVWACLQVAWSSG